MLTELIFVPGFRGHLVQIGLVPGCGGGTDGPNLVATVAGGRKASHCEAPICVVENVQGFPDGLVHDAYGPSFSWSSMNVTPADVGFEFISRTRIPPLES